MQGPAPINIGGTGRRGGQRSRTVTGGKKGKISPRADGGRYETGRMGEDISCLKETGAAATRKWI